MKDDIQFKLACRDIAICRRLISKALYDKHKEFRECTTTEANEVIDYVHKRIHNNTGVYVGYRRTVFGREEEVD